MTALATDDPDIAANCVLRVDGSCIPERGTVIGRERRGDQRKSADYENDSSHGCSV